MFSSTRFAGELDKYSFGVEERGKLELIEVTLRENERREIGDINSFKEFFYKEEQISRVMARIRSKGKYF